MKRLKFLFLSMAALLIGVPQAKAQRMIGAIVNPDEFKDGMEIQLGWSLLPFHPCGG